MPAIYIYMHNVLFHYSVQQEQGFADGQFDMSITHMTFGKEFTQAVKQKQIAQQEAEQVRFTVEKVPATPFLSWTNGILG
jgi:hypothetical protein